MSKTHFDYIVLGCGGIGSGAAYWLARRAGASVLGLEQFPLGHVHGGSQDHSRIIRLTYHHEHYTRLTPHTYTAWATLEDESGVQVVHKTGSVELALNRSPHLRELDIYAGAMDAAHIPYERFDGAELRHRFPQFRVTQDVDVLWQAETGLADAGRGNAAHIATARLHGATVLDQCPVTGLHPFEGGVDVETEYGTFTARKLIVTAGSWVDEVLAWVGQTLRVTVMQEQVTYYATPHLRDFAIGRFPIWIWHGDEVLYGFPVYGEVATKAAIDAAGPIVTARTRSYDPDPARERVVEDWLREYIPGFLGPKLYTKTCLYDMPRDRNFVIDALPGHPQILVCNGAGHAYKFAGLLGKILSELAIDGQTPYPIAPFTFNRPAITDPDFPAVFHI
jgi:sarcosine oxidase